LPVELPSFKLSSNFQIQVGTEFETLQLNWQMETLHWQLAKGPQLEKAVEIGNDY
jgi:hypothetical protein